MSSTDGIGTVLKQACKKEKVFDVFDRFRSLLITAIVYLRDRGKRIGTFTDIVGTKKESFGIITKNAKITANRHQKSGQKVRKIYHIDEVVETRYTLEKIVF